MKKLKFIPSVLMLFTCVAILCVGVFSLTPTENTIGGTINISSMARVKLSCYVDEELVYDSQNTAYGVDWNLTETALNFDVSNYTLAEEVPLRTIRIHIQNLTSLHLGAYFYNGDETTLQTINGEKYATYDSLKLTDAVYKAGQEGNADEKFADITLSPYGYIAPATPDNTYDEYDMFINIDITKLDITEVSKAVSYMLRIEEYHSNVTINDSNVASFTPLANKTKQLVKLPTNNSNTAVPTLADASYGGVVIPTTYISIPENGLTACTGLTAISIPQSIAAMGSSSLKNCSAIYAVDWHVVTISDFSNDPSDILGVQPPFSSSVSIINFSSSVDYIPAALCGSSVKNVFVPGGVQFGSYVFRGTNIDNIVICEGVTTLSDNMFQGSQIKYVSLPSTLELINRFAFSSCGNLSSIIIPDNVTTIGGDSFSSCTSLKSIVIGEKVSSYQNLYDGIFSNCSSLTDITIRSEYTYTNAGSAYVFGGLFNNATTIKVLASIIDGGATGGAYLTNTSNFSRSTTPIDGYYVFTKVSA